MIVLDTKGIIVFVAQDIWNILRFQPSEIVGTELINFLPDDQKWFVEKKITLAPPFRNRVGTTIEFCCDFKRGDSSEIGPPTYEYVKFILSLKNAIDEPVFFGANQSFRVTHSHYLCDEHFYFVGTVCILKNDILKEIYKKVRFTKIEIKEESDEGSSEYKMGIEAKRRRKMDMKDGIKYCKMEAASTRSSLSLNDNTNIENAQQDTWQENAPINVKRSDSSTSLQNKAPSPGLSFSPSLPWQTEVDPRLKQVPIDIELPVDPIFLYHSSNDDDDDDDGPPHLEKYVDFESYDSESPDGSLRGPPILRAFYCIEETSNTDDSSDWRESNENSTSFRKNFLHPPNLTCLLNEETNQEAPEMPVLRHVYSFTTTDDQMLEVLLVRSIALFT
ncbi:circadian clock protein PASD1 [Thomomys bottae]